MIDPSQILSPDQAVTALINDIPSGDQDKDIEKLETFLTKSPLFKEPFEKFKLLDLNVMTNDKKIGFAASFLVNARNVKNVKILFDFFKEYLSEKDLYTVMLESQIFCDLMVSDFMKNSDKLQIILDIFSQYENLKPHQRYIRQSAFRFISLRKETENCLKILYSVYPSRSHDDFLEFSTYATSITPLISENQTFARELFEYVMNLAAILKGFMRDWLINFASSFAPLLKLKSVHPAILDFVKFQKKPQITINHFEASTGGLYNKELSLSEAPALSRPYSLHKEWFVDIKELSSAKTPEDAYNTLLYFCQTNPNEATQILNQIPTSVSLPLYLVIMDRQPDAFHSAVEKAINSGNIEISLQVLEKVARINPALIKPHFQSISKLGFAKCQVLVSLLIKADMIEFKLLFNHIKNSKEENVRAIIREGILQMQKRPKTRENIDFILSVFTTFYRGASSQINWSAVADAFPGDFDIAQCMLLSTDDATKSEQGKTKLSEWKNSFLAFIRRSPATMRVLSAIPYLLVASTLPDFKPEEVHSIVSLLPSSRNKSEEILERIALLELARSVIKGTHPQDDPLRKLSQVFDFDQNRITSYASVFAHAAVCLEIGVESSFKQIESLLTQGNSSLMRNAAKTAMIMLNVFSFEAAKKFNFDDEEKELTIKIMSLLSPSMQPSTYKPKDTRLISMIERIHSMVAADIDEICSRKEFGGVEEIRENFLTLGLACFILLPSRTVSKSSSDRVLQMALNTSSSVNQREFALLAISQMQTAPEANYEQILVKWPELAKSIMQVAVRNNNNALIQHILEKSNDYKVIFSLKTLLAFVDQEIILKFIEKTAGSADLQTLLLSIDLFNNTQHIIAVINAIRKFEISGIVKSGGGERLKNALLRLSQEELDKFVYSDFDDFALVSSYLTNMSVSNVCWKIVQSSKISVKALVDYAFARKRQIFTFIEGFFAVMQHTSVDQTDRAIVALSIFMLINETNQPFLIIKQKIEANPSMLDENALVLLLPSLISACSMIRSEHTAIFEQISTQKFATAREEIVNASRLRK